MTTPALSLDQIAERLQGYDPQALPASQVNAFLAQLVQPVREQETVPLMQAHGRILAQDVVSPISVPPHDNSAMDGYALRGTELLSDRPTPFTVVGTAFAHQPHRAGQHARAAVAHRAMNGLCIKRIALFAQGMQGLVVQLFAIHLVPQAVDLPALEFAAGDLRLQVLHEGLGDTHGGLGAL